MRRPRVSPQGPVAPNSRADSPPHLRHVGELLSHRRPPPLQERRRSAHPLVRPGTPPPCGHGSAPSTQPTRPAEPPYQGNERPDQQHPRGTEIDPSLTPRQGGRQNAREPAA